MANNQFIARKGLIALDDSQITGSLSITGAITGSIFTGSFKGDGSQLSGVSAGFPFTGSATISGSLQVTGSVSATAFIGDGSQLTGIADPTPITATINNTNSPFTITSQSIVIIDSTNGDVTVNLPDLDLIDGTPDQKPILLYKNDYSQNVIYVEPSGSQLVNGTTQDIIVSIQIAIAYNPTSAGWVTEGTSYQSLAELELFFVPRTETGSFATTGSNQFSGSQTITGSLTVTGNITGNITGSASTASYVEYTNVANKPALVSGSSQITYSGLTGIPSGIVSGSSQVTYSGLSGIPSGIVSGSSQVTYSDLTGIPSGIVSGSTQISDFGIFATTGSNQFNGSQAITGSLTTTGTIVAQTLNVQQVTSSIVYSSGSNIFGNSVSNTQQFTGSLQVSSSTSYILGNVGINTTTPVSTNLVGALTIVKSYSGDTPPSPSAQSYDINQSNLYLFGRNAGITLVGALNEEVVIAFGNPSDPYIGGIRYSMGSGADSGDFYIQTGGTNERLRILSTGNVGIGTASPNDLMEIKSSTANQANYRLYNTFNDGANNFGINWFRNYDSATNSQGAFINYVRMGGSAGDLAFGTGTVSGGITERMRITSAGRIGIQNTDPQGILEVGDVDVNSTYGGHFFSTFNIPVNTWYTVFYAPNNNWAAITEFTWTSGADYNRSGAAYMRWAYNAGANALGVVYTLFNDSQNSTATFRNTGGEIQINISGGAAHYYVQVRIQGSKAA